MEAEDEPNQVPAVMNLETHCIIINELSETEQRNLKKTKQR
ncbi:18079_t:CDS:1, partial [Funneliformis geosporum]